MNTSNGIDTASLLTIFSLIAAVWAVIPANSRLRFKLSMTIGDWIFVTSIIALVHYLVFEPILQAASMYYSLGPWQWGFDKGTAVYLLWICLGVYIFIRSRAPKLANRNIKAFTLLVDNLLSTKQYTELVGLVDPQLKTLLRLEKKRPITKELISLAKPNLREIETLHAHLRGETPPEPSAIKKKIHAVLTEIERFIDARDHVRVNLNDLFRRLSNTPSFIKYAAVSHPRFCLKMLERPDVVRDEFLDLFVSSLLEDVSSELYIELKNSEQLNGRHRLLIPPSNFLLSYFFKDVNVAAKLGLYGAVGEDLLRNLKEDHRLLDSLNRPIGYYQERGKYQCPIYGGIKLFEIMVHEGIHQGIQDHLWLHYFPHFTRAILEGMRQEEPEDSHHEFATQFYYLLYQLVAISSNWAEGCVDVNAQNINTEIREDPDFQINYIPIEACDAMGLLTQYILLSPKITDRFKHYVLEIVLRAYARIRDHRQQEVAQQLSRSFVTGIDIPTDLGYRVMVLKLFSELDHQLRIQVPEILVAIQGSIQEVEG